MFKLAGGGTATSCKDRVSPSSRMSRVEQESSVLPLVVTLHPWLSTDHQGVHQPKINVPIVARKGTPRTLARFWRLNMKLSVVGSQSALLVWHWTPAPQRTIDIFGNCKNNGDMP